MKKKCGCGRAGPDGENKENNITGAKRLRWTEERRCAFETVLDYCRLKREKNPPKAYLVSAGLEPLSFTCLFPNWVPDEHVTEINAQDGSSQGEIQSIEKVLERLKRTTYSLEELQERPTPEGVDPSKLESYLNDDDFQDVMEMTKADFYALPSWKQNQLRKKNGLF